MRVIGLSGAQGSGKSSMLLELRARGWKLDEFRVSRAVQAQLGWDSLARVMDAPETMMQFQQEVFAQKLKRDSELAAMASDQRHDRDGSQNSVILTERTFADIWAYTSMWTWRFHEQNKLTFSEALAWLTPYTKLCADAQSQVYSGVLLLPFMNHITFEDDTHRASRADVDSVYEDVDRFVERKTPNMRKLYITSETVGDRAAQVETFLRSF
jgi:predicted ATPase